MLKQFREGGLGQYTLLNTRQLVALGLREDTRKGTAAGDEAGLEHTENLQAPGIGVGDAGG